MPRPALCALLLAVLASFAVTASASTRPTRGTVTSDTTRPELTLTVAPPAWTGEPSPALGGQYGVDPGDDPVQAVLVRGTDIETGEAIPLSGEASNGSYSFAPVDPLTDGTYSYAVSQTDTAHNAEEHRGTFTVDTIAPQPTLDDLDVTDDPTPTVRGTRETGAGTGALGVLFTKGAETVSAAAEADGTDPADWKATPTALGEGRWTVTATQLDLAGNSGDADDELVVDTTAPAITLTSAADGTTTNDPAQTVTWTSGASDGTGQSAQDAPAVLTAKRNGTTVSTGPVATASGSHTYALSGDGTWQFTLEQSDAAGNAATPVVRTLVLDTRDPVASFLSAPNGTVRSSAARFVLASDEAGTTYACELDGEALASCPATLDLTGLAPGPHMLEVIPTDVADNDGDPLTRAWTVDPAATTDSASGDAGPGQTVSYGSAGAPLTAAVTTPTGGVVTLTEGPLDTAGAAAPPATGYLLAGRSFVIEAPDATTADPLRLRFTFDRAQLPAGTTAANLVVFRDGVPIAPCLADTVADPDPCVADRESAGDEIAITVLSSHASVWAFGRVAAPAAGGGGSGGGGGGGGSSSGGDPEPAAAEEPAPTAPAAAPSGPRVRPVLAPLTVVQLRAQAARLLGRAPAALPQVRLGAVRAYGVSRTQGRGELRVARTATSVPLLAVTCPSECRVIATQRLTVGRRTFRLPTTKRSLFRAGALVRLELTKQARSALTAAHGRGRLRVGLSVTDADDRNRKAVLPLALR